MIVGMRRRVELPVYVSLGRKDRGAVVDLLSEATAGNVILLYNISVHGMEPGRSPFHGAYFGRRESSGLAAAEAVYNLGSMFFYSRTPGAIDGMADYVLGLGRLPDVLQGKAEHVDRLLEDSSARLRVEGKMSMELMALRGPVAHGIPTYAARPSEPRDLGTLFDLQARLEKELFGEKVGEDMPGREILSRQVERGTAYLVEEGGTIVSKAEATVLPGVGGWIGGVYTLPERRGRGYSTACMAALCENALERAPVLALTADKDNYVSRGVYRRIGFEKVDDWILARVAPP
jgi:GNAT superfamily N-acetyltransferase